MPLRTFNTALSGIGAASARIYSASRRKTCGNDLTCRTENPSPVLWRIARNHAKTERPFCIPRIGAFHLLHDRGLSLSAGLRFTRPGSLQPQSSQNLIQVVRNGLQCTTTIEQIGYAAQQIAEQVAGARLRNDVEIDWVRDVHDESEQVQM